MSYTTPLRDIRFAMKELAGLDEILKLPGFEEAEPDLVDAILDENARFVQEVVAPLNVIGDRQPPVWKDGAVTATPGFAKHLPSIRPEGGKACSTRCNGAARVCRSWWPRLPAKTSRQPVWRLPCVPC